MQDSQSGKEKIMNRHTKNIPALFFLENGFCRFTGK